MRPLLVDLAGRVFGAGEIPGPYPGLRLAEVGSGLSEGENVIVYPNDRIAEGVRIAPRG